ncbi:MAG: type VI secretion system tip protein VgrG, partial [Planctomycetes bacterium]|nr:type VI secretion system tip protein VgrG [Planctomycetota bacterium]
MAMKQATRSLKLFTPLGEDELLLTAFQGREEFSRLFRFELEMISDNNAIAAKDIVGKNVSFSVERSGGQQRWFNGFVSRFVAGDEDDEGRRNYRAQVIPWLWFLTRTSDCRIFQNKKVPDIIAQIFNDLGFSDFDISKIKGAHPKWDYCVQYRETDFNFVSRLMEQEGICYYFKHEKGKHTLILADQKTAYEKCPEGEVDFPRDFATAAVVDHITSWEHAYEFRTGKWAHTDYNFETPSNSLMTTEQTVIQLPGVEKFEHYDYPGEYATTGDGAPLAKVRMEEEELEHDVVQGSSTCKTFAPGCKFTIGQHRCQAEEGKGYVITSVRHSATEPLAYETGSSDSGPGYDNTFSCIPDSVMFRPARITSKPIVQGCQTAMVTGPAGEEIYPDKYGRVKVQFHWDREGKKDENTSCWIRVSQIHAGKGWGAMDIPRIGEEVIVDFLEGDPDRPIIIGRVYHAENMPPYGLPGSKNLYGIKSNSTKGGGGYNEYVFDDTKGNELVREHGQFDKDSTIEH